jgi:hypothetical protein
VGRLLKKVMVGGEVAFNLSRSPGANVTREVDKSCARKSWEEKRIAKMGFFRAAGVSKTTPEEPQHELEAIEALGSHGGGDLSDLSLYN